jgi:sodium-dependent dicarboxylate transporter 2/3/5
VVTSAAVLWITSPILNRVITGISDAGIAIAAALALFLLPGDRGRRAILEWEDAERLPWGVLLLFGGGLSLARAIDQSGLASWIGTALEPIGVLHVVVVVLCVTAVIVFLTEITSNTATAAAFLPVVGALALAIGQDPVVLAVSAAVGASCAFMLPVATPPNAIVYGSGQVNIMQMVRAGFWLNLFMIALITIFAFGPIEWIR